MKIQHDKCKDYTLMVLDILYSLSSHLLASSDTSISIPIEILREEYQGSKSTLFIVNLGTAAICKSRLA
jgi:hypothetical protein